MNRTRTTLAAVLAAAALLSACGPESEVEDVAATTNDAAPTTAGAGSGRVSDLPPATEAPDSSERGVTGRAQVEVPEGWTEARVDDVFDLRYLSGEGARDPLLSLSGGYGRFQGARAGASTLIAQIQMGTPGFTIHGQDDIEVPGADSAVRVDFSFGTPEEEDGVFDGMWIVAVDSSDGHTIALALSGGDDQLDEDDFDDVAQTFQMLPGQE